MVYRISGHGDGVVLSVSVWTAMGRPPSLPTTVGGCLWDVAPCQGKSLPKISSGCNSAIAPECKEPSQTQVLCERAREEWLMDTRSVVGSLVVQEGKSCSWKRRPGKLSVHVTFEVHLSFFFTAHTHYVWINREWQLYVHTFSRRGARLAFNWSCIFGRLMNASSVFALF